MDFISAERRRIDDIDRRLIKLLEQRFNIVFRLKKWKIKNKIKIEDKNREKSIIKKFEKRKVPKNFVNNFFNLLFKEAKK